MLEKQEKKLGSMGREVIENESCFSLSPSTAPPPTHTQHTHAETKYNNLAGLNCRAWGVPDHLAAIRGLCEENEII